jgi:hypothetical protein
MTLRLGLFAEKNRRRKKSGQLNERKRRTRSNKRGDQINKLKLLGAVLENQPKWRGKDQRGQVRIQRE